MTADHRLTPFRWVSLASNRRQLVADLKDAEEFVSFQVLQGQDVAALEAPDGIPFS